MSESRWNHGGAIHADDDPRNLSPKLYLPILIAALLAALLAYVIFAPKH